jgi:type IV pilus assembly protein PilB
MARNERFGEYLVNRSMLTQNQLTQALNRQKIIKDKIGRTVVKEGLMDQETLLSELSGFLGIPLMSDTVTDIQPGVIPVIPQKMCRKTGVLPVASGDRNELLLACSGPVPKALLQNISRLAQRQVKLVLTTREKIIQLQNHYFSQSFDTTIRAESLSAEGATTYIIELFEKIMVRAINAGASDVHVEPEKEELIIRFRIDGVMKKTESLPADTAGKLISRIKVLGGLDIAERRKPQDGAFYFTPRLLDLSMDGVNVRMSTLPVIHGEKAVLRLLPPHDVRIGLETLGMPAAMFTAFSRSLRAAHGIILVTGPTGSGKSTTLYGAIQELRSEHTNITTIEEPVELTVRGVSQTQVNPGEKITFATALRAILRQDPDIIMVGEIRDTETLNIALRAAVTGHLVLSTLHTNDAPSAFNRMIDMGAEPFLVAASVRMVLGQRLARKTCPACAVSRPASDSERAVFGLEQDTVFNIRQGTGCEQCTLGYQGRTGIFELLEVNEPIRRLIMDRATFDEIRTFALDHTAYTTMRQDGIEKIRQGVTTPDEIMRITLE